MTMELSHMYFRFSNFQQRESALWSWFNHFKNKGIACCIVKHGPECYSLFREGMEWTVHGIQKGFENIDGEILKSYDPNGVFDS